MGTSVTGDRQRNGWPSTSPNGPVPTFLGILAALQPQYRFTRKDLFAYACEFLTLGSSATSTQTIAIAGDTDFIIQFAMCLCTDSANTTMLTFIPQLVQLTDSASGISFFNLPLPAQSVYGDAQNPGIFAIPKVMRQATTLAVQHQNLEAVARNVRCAFIGMKSYPGTDVREKRWQDGGG